jgi:hypothetical protein
MTVHETWRKYADQTLVVTDIFMFGLIRYHPQRSYDPLLCIMTGKNRSHDRRPVVLPISGAAGLKLSKSPQPKWTLPGERGVAIAAAGDPTYEEIAEMAAEALVRQQIRARVVHDGDPVAFDHALLLLVGSGSYFPRFAEMARSWSMPPRIVLWHQQPLPPPVLTQRASELGHRLLSARWEDVFGRWSRALGFLPAAKGRMRTMLQQLLAVPVRQEFERLGGAEYANVGWDDLCTVFEEAAWLKSTFDEPHPWIDSVACSTPTRVAFLQQCGIAARFVPLGFHAAWGEPGEKERDIDVLFVGTCHSPGRRSLVPEVLRRLRDWGYRTHEAGVFPCGRERTELLQRARVVLNVLRFPWEFPGPRLFASAACGALVVSNEAVQNEPFDAGLHYIRAPRARMAESISWYLTHEEERRRRAAQALHSFSQDFPLLTSLEKLLAPAPPAMHRQSRAA